VPLYLTDSADATAVPIVPLDKAGLEEWLKTQPPALGRWVESTRFTAEPGTASLVAGADGALARVLAGIGGDGVAPEDEMWDWAALSESLPRGSYRIDAALDTAAANGAALGWALATYRFDRYRRDDKSPSTLAVPDACDRVQVERAARATFLVRDLINTPAMDMGPGDLAAAARRLAKDHGARCRVVTGDALLEENYPAIHAVGRASARPPCLIDLKWGDADAPKVTLVGKGVCFDTGGLDIKPAEFMKLMKKDMGGAATMLGLADMIMAAALPVRLRLLIPAVENSISGNALYPLDVVTTRKGLTVEIGHTDAEGRVILADALTEAASESPELLIDYATLTGAARVALGPDVPALFCNDDELAAGVLDHGTATADPLWRMPLWKPYRKKIESKVANLTNAPEGSHGGAITAALFLAEFVDSHRPWAHIDVMAWNAAGRPGRPEGGEAMGMRAWFAFIAKRFGGRR
jgi:leucyl aminopeptidase